MKNTLKETGQEMPFRMAVVMLMFAVGLILIPLDRLVNAWGVSGALAVSRTVYAAFGIFLICALGFTGGFRLHRSFFRWWDVVLAAALVAVNNFPFVALFTGTAWLTASSAQVAAFAAQCLAVGLFEEIFFRGLIFVLLLRGLPDTPRGKFLAIAISSVLFGLTHFLNLLGGASVGAVLLQTGYSALLGAMLSTVYLLTRTIWIPVLLHAVYNFGGQLFMYCGVGELWGLWQVALTALVAVGAVIWIVLRFVKFCKERQEEKTI